ncbi:hypothetical protein LIER_34375 [Lithospermum erythrorhizon]|uniref:MULE transposase domain-containing protein n=1 Tax=Lithospermum erythrorhizon TaxID=34254 RepID=A0AAV3S0S2_LITER
MANSLTFTVTYCFLSTEKEETFIWALKNLRSFFVSVLPTAIVTARELGLINAVGLIFPESKHMLCRRHIDMAIKSKALKHSGGSEAFGKSFVWHWNEAISSYVEDIWNLKWLKMEKDYAKNQLF